MSATAVQQRIIYRRNTTSGFSDLFARQNNWASLKWRHSRPKSFPGVEKTCQDCKCCRDAHDIYHKEWVNVRDRLGLKSETPDTKPLSREKSFAQGFSWVPGCLPPFKVEQYFKCLPAEKVPKLGSEGEKYREKQIIHQLPKQDMALAYCRHVESGNHNSYENFINARNELAIDIAFLLSFLQLTCVYYLTIKE